MNILGIIPARGGSKGLPRKNVHTLAGQPLIWYTFTAAKASQWLSRVILTTDDEETATYGRTHQIEVPFLRPPELARDDTPSLPVIQHALTFLETSEGYSPDLVVLLQPTAPLRRAEHIDEAIQLLLTHDAEAVVSVAPVPTHFNPHWVLVMDERSRLQPFLTESGPQWYPRRQALPPVYYRNGAIYVARRELILERHSLYGTVPLAYVMPSEVSVNIDGAADLWMAEWLLQRQSETGG